MELDIMHTPYTYLIGWTAHNKWYYGVRFAKNCNPDDLWVTYFTSSSYVQEFRKQHGDPDVIEVRRTFLSQADARLWEETVLNRLNAVKDEKWLNRCNQGKHFFRPFFTEAALTKISEAHKGKIVSDKQRIKISIALKGKPKSDQAANNIRAVCLKNLKKAVEMNTGRKRLQHSKFMKARYYDPTIYTFTHLDRTLFHRNQVSNV